MQECTKRLLALRYKANVSLVIVCRTPTETESRISASALPIILEPRSDCLQQRFKPIQLTGESGRPTAGGHWVAWETPTCRLTCFNVVT